jgi:hypothetical protein
MIDAQRAPEQQLALAIKQHERHGWTLAWRKEDPPCARMRVVVEPPERLPLGMVVTQTTKCRNVTCRDITIAADGKAVWVNVSCDSD